MRDEASNTYGGDDRKFLTYCMKVGFAHELKPLLDHIKEEFGLELEPMD